MTKLYSFIDIFNSTFTDEKDEAIKLNKIVIPIIQRDYAQGRMDPDIKRIRNRFLEALYKAITEKPITLDFVYGDIDKFGVLTPLDGQQRLTTLFLLHWYAAKKETIKPEEYDFLNKFSYETRFSARDFCEKLVAFTPSFTKKTISEEIINQSWFPWEWQKDATISSMLVMLDDIREQFLEVKNIWDKLKGNAITFYFLPIKDIDLTDELYIKMNSRGKPLSTFENVKAELEHELKKVDSDLSKDIIKKIDQDWTDMLWQFKDEYNTIDNAFLRYFRFICDIICYKQGDTPSGQNLDELELVNKYFSSNCCEVKENVKLLESLFDCWNNISKKTGIENFFNKFVSHNYAEGKILFENRDEINVFKDCLESYGTLINNTKKREFPLGRLIILYAFIVYCLNLDKVNENEFRRRIRIINNLVKNSSDEMSNSVNRQGGNRIPAILKQVDSIIINGEIKTDLEMNFNARQLAEEKEKLIWTNLNPDKEETLFKLEDNGLLFGQISIIGLENFQLFDTFGKLFKCDLDKIDKALLSIGNYSQQESRRVIQLGSIEKSSWIRLFHPTKNFDNTKNIICKLLMMNQNPDNYFLDKLAEEYIKACQTNNLFDWRYYYIKYDVFRPGKFGKYCLEDMINKPYEMLAMVTNKNISENSYQPFLKAVDEKNHLSKEHFGQRIIDGDKYIIVENNAYIIYSNTSNSEIEKIIINQNENGIDIEDRIEKFLKIYK